MEVGGGLWREERDEIEPNLESWPALPLVKGSWLPKVVRGVGLGDLTITPEAVAVPRPLPFFCSVPLTIGNDPG